MAGHNKWSKIRHKKAKEDAKKGKIFSKLSGQITYAARQGGGDPDLNPALRLLLDIARAESFPADNVKKAIEKGTGEGDNAVILVEASYEGFGPGGISLIVDTLTDNTNRTVSTLRRLFSDIGGNMGDSGSVSWNFEVKGYVSVRPGTMKKAQKFGDPDEFVPADSDEVMMELMDMDGVEDIEETDIDGKKLFGVFSEFQDFAKVRDAILATDYVVKEASIMKLAKNDKVLAGEELEKALNGIDRIEEIEDVQNVWTDLVQE